ncbi:hypothetical protein Tco_1322467 [Tanacetum coccineum]
MESYYTRFYKMMNEMIRNNLTVATMQVNIQFLQQLQPEWSRLVTIVKQQHKLDEVSYHKLFNILKQYQKEVNEIRDERIAKNANPLALVAVAQQYPDPYYQAPKSHKPYAPTSKQASSTRSNASTKLKGKEIAKPITPLSESPASEEDSNLEQAQGDKDMYKNDNQTGQFRKQRIVNVVRARETVGSQEKMLLCKQAEKGVQVQVEQSDWLAYMDEEIDEQELEAHYSYMAKTQEVPTVDSGTDSEPLEHVQYDAGYYVFANEREHYEQPESIKCDDERVVLANLIANLELDVDENKKIQKQLKKANPALAHELTECKSILAKTSRTLGESNSIRDSCLVALQNKQTGFERYKTLNDRTVDYEKIKHKLNETLGLLAQKDNDIKEGLKLKAYEISVVQEKHDELVKQSLLTKSHYEGLVKEKTKVITDLKLKEEKDIDKMIIMEKQLKFFNKIVYKRNQSIQTIHMLAPKGATLNGRPTFANPMYLKNAQSEKPCLYEIPHDQSDPANRLVPDREETLTLENESRLKLNKDLMCTMNCNANLHKVKECDRLAQKLSKQTKSVSKEVYTELLRSFAKLEKHSISLELALQQCQEQMKNDTLKKLIEKCKEKSMETKFDKPSVVRQPNAQRIPKPSVLGKLTPFLDSLERKHFSKTKSVPKTNVSEGVIHKTTVSRPQLRSTQMKDKVVPNTSQVKFKKTEVEDHHRIFSISNKTKSATVCNDSLKFRTSNVNVVCATCGKYVFNSNHDSCVSKYLNDMNARTKKPKVVPISTRKSKNKANKFVATPYKIIVAPDITI